MCKIHEAKWELQTRWGGEGNMRDARVGKGSKRGEISTKKKKN